MADPSERISELKIDRDAPTPGRRGWLIPAIAAAAALTLLTLLAWQFYGDSKTVTVQTDIATRPPNVGAASSVLDASGYVVARRQATVSSKVTGKVREVLVEEGMRVEEGQIVARLDDTTEKARLDYALAQVEAARAILAETQA